MTLAALSFSPFEFLVFSSFIVITLAVFLFLFFFRLSASTNICLS